MRFGSGAGQHLGHKPPLAFYAALSPDSSIQQEVRAIANDPALQGTFQEDTQIYLSEDALGDGTRRALWGDDYKGYSCRTGTLDDCLQAQAWYWSRFAHDNQGSQRDPYGFIDGPAGGPHPDYPTGQREYLFAASGGPLISYAFMQHLMPWLRFTAGDDEILDFADRIYAGYGVNNFNGGWWSAPDPCAPFDPNDNPDCDRRDPTTCTRYGVTYGPDPSNPWTCIRHNGNPYTDGRRPQAHGTFHQLAGGKLFYNFGTFTGNLWDGLRECSDPAHPSYPCDGLGEFPNN